MKNSERDRKIIAASGLFDANWYLEQYPDVGILGMDPIEHYLMFGAVLKRDPGPGFDTGRYVEANPDVATSGLNPLVHFLSRGKGSASPSFAKPAAIVPLAARADKMSDETLVASSPLFDPDWYRAEYPDIARLKVDPLRHFLRHGFREGRNPGPRFHTRWYAERYSRRMRHDNPLIDYLRNGQPEGRETQPSAEAKAWWSDLPPATNVHKETNNPLSGVTARLAAAPARPAIIVPVYNAAEETEACVLSVLRNTRLDYRLILVDDCSPDPAVRQVLDRFRAIEQVEIHYNEKNLGFSGTINRGIELAGRSDVVFLNSDTLVTPNWLDRMRYAAYSTERTATVTAVSNNAGAFSVPESGSNEMPPYLSLDAYGRAIAQTALRLYPETPTGNGFCMYVRRDCIDEVGILDAEAFPRGYGEENDFCMRAGRKGWRHIVDDATFVYHVRSASFGSSKDDLMKQGRAVVDSRYPDYTARVRDFVRAEPLKTVRQRVASLLRAIGSRPDVVKPRALYVLSTKTGGTPQTNQDLMGAVDDLYETFVLRSNALSMTISSFKDGVYTELERHVLSSAIHAYPHTSEDYDDVVSVWLARYGIELMHVRHIAWHSLGLVRAAKTLNIPVIFSFHDFYTICPSVKLLDLENRYHGGKCDTAHVNCRKELWDKGDFLALPDDGVDHWKKIFGEMLAECDGFVTTVRQARRIVLDNFPQLGGQPFEVIAHGRDFAEFTSLAVPYASGEVLKILLAGNIDEPKGSEVVYKLSDYAIAHGFEFHVIGSALASLASASGQQNSLPGVVLHGPYERQSFGDLVRRIRPHVGAVLSIWPETFCHTLTELWSCGLPVMGFDIGAVGERIKDTNAGWVAQEMKPEAILQLIDGLRSDPERIERATDAVRAWQVGLGSSRTCAAMAADYIAFYADTEARRRARLPQGMMHQPEAPVVSGGMVSAAALYDVDVVVPVYNALEFTRDCLLSIKRHPDGLRVRTFVVNDGSDEQTTSWLREFCAGEPDFVLKEHDGNKGYTTAVNTGLMASSAEFVITLNSDTVVTKGWLTGMIRCMRSDARIGICGPLSNAASWQNVPDLYAEDGSFAINEVPGGLTADEFSTLIAETSKRDYPRAPFVNGFCYMIKRAVVDAIGFMDPINFPIGYGEENDYCIRAADAGFTLAYADDAYVFHAKSKSFGHGKRKQLARDGAKALRDKHGLERVEALIEQVKVTTAMDVVRNRVAEALGKQKLDGHARKSVVDVSVLFLLPVRGGGGGVHSIVQEVMGMRRLGVSAEVAVKLEDLDYYHSQYSDIDDVASLFRGFDTDEELVDLAKRFQVVVATIFTSVVLLKKISDERPEILPAYYVQDYEPWFWKPTKPQWLQARESYELVPHALYFAKTNWLTRQVYAEHNMKVVKVEPSIDHMVYKPSVLPSEKIVVSAMIRPRTPRRGAARTMRVLNSLHKRFGEGIEIHIFGCEEDDSMFCEMERGFPYINHEIIKRLEVAEILARSDIFLDLSDYQAFGRTGLEGMACGCVPVLPKIGGADEYAVDGHNAIVVDTKDEDAVLRSVCSLLEQPEKLIEHKQAALRTAARYSVHLAAVSELTAFQAALRERKRNPRQGARPKALIIPSGQKDSSPTGSAYVRLIHPYMQAEVRKEWDVSLGESQTLPEATDASVLLVERDIPGSDAASIRSWARRMRGEGRKIIYEVDDDLLDVKGLRSRGYNKDVSPLGERVRALAEIADAITVSTVPLKERFGSFNSNVRVVPNYLNYQMWKLEEDQAPTKPKTDDVIKIGYIGTPSHSVDMHIVKDAVHKIQARYGKKVQFEVIGAFQTQEPLFGKRIGLPRNNNYAPFVDWLFKVVDWDIGITPLVDDDFNRCKSNLKFLEYAALRLPNIVSDVYTYRDVAKHEVNSLLVRNSTQEWTDALVRLIENPSLREQLKTNAFEMVRKHYSVRHHVGDYLNVLNFAE